MSLVIGYLAVGVVVLCVMVAIERWRDRGRSASTRAVDLRALPAAHATMWQRLLDRFVSPLLGGTVFVVLWPLMLALQFWTRPAGKERTDGEGEPWLFPREREFAVGPGDLLEQFPAEEIERRERVSDPLGAVPDLPFGHLHPAWQAFLAKRGPGDALWSFSTHWTTAWGHEELREGYVIVRESVIGQHFLTVWRSLEVP
jgi:hypothetical protein